MKKTGIQFLFFGLLLTLFFGCDKNRIFEEYKEISTEGWHKDSLMVFTIPVTDTLQNYNLYLNVRNNINFNYSNLWLFVEINQPGEIAVTDTFEVSLAAPSGEWLGEGFGGIKTRQVVYRSGVYFPITGDYIINIQQGMREELLEGITDVGFRVEKVAH